MDSSKRMTYAIVFVILIVFISLIVAYITFNILQSSAEANLKEWKLGGAFAAFVFTASMLSSIAFQFYKHLADDEVKKLNEDLLKMQTKYTEKIQELEAKIIKGAPCPDGFTIDLDEKHKLVFARPSEWTPRAGILYQYINAKNFGKSMESFNVMCHSPNDLEVLYDYFKINKDEHEIDNLYNAFADNAVSQLSIAMPAFAMISLNKEYIFIDNYKSLKYMLTYSSQADEKSEKIFTTLCGVLIYVKRNKTLYEFNFGDGKDEYLVTSEIFNNVIASIRIL